MRSVKMPVNRTAFIDTIIFAFILSISLGATLSYCYFLGYSYTQNKGYGPQNFMEYLPFAIEGSLNVLALVIATAWYYDLNQPVSILHPNVKLICHTICVGIYIGCIARIITVFDVFSDFSFWIKFMQFPFHAKNIVVVQCNINPMLLGLERFMATVYVKQYERVQLQSIGIGVIVASWSTSAIVNYALWSQYFHGYFIIGIVVNGFFAVFTVVTVIFYIWLSKKNHQHFALTAATSALSERYQTAENIRHLRAIKQNASVNLIANGLIVVFNALFLLIQYQQWNKVWEKRLDGLWNITFSVECILLPLPFLQVTGRIRKIRRGINKFFNVNMTNDSQTVASFELTKVPAAATIKSVTGQQVPLTGTQTDYFKMFDKSWNPQVAPGEKQT